MKKRDWYAAALILLLAIGVYVISFVFQKPAKTLHIYVDGELYGSYSLLENQEVHIGETNTCTIENGKVRMSSADCPDQICVHTAQISQDGMTIVCLPNKVVLEIQSEEESENPVDGISS